MLYFVFIQYKNDFVFMNESWKNSNIFICGTAKNCESHIDSVFENIHKIIKLFADFRIIIAFDTSIDLTLEKLCYQKNIFDDKMHVIINRTKLSNIRTQNISNARNECLNKMRELIAKGYNSDYFAMIDLDDVCSGFMDIDVIKCAMNREANWDSVSFNRHGYYDIWALSIDEYVYSCWGWLSSWEVVEHMRSYIIEKLSKIPLDEFVECRSAFNGFAIYKTKLFLNCNYDWTMPKQYMSLEELLNQQRMLWNVGSVSPLEIQTDEPDCEHRTFHMMAIHKNGARIRISPAILFS